MARCWTCGTYSRDLTYACATCRQLSALREVKDAAHAASLEANERLDKIADLQRNVHQALLEGFDRLNQTMEWGFSSLQWSIDQQTEVLRSIDATLKTPGQTQANEWRIIGERLRQRGESESAEKFFVRALESNPLDFRIYLGLAHVYFELSRFDDADRVLIASLPHAPRKQFDYRSVAYRLMGRIRFCNEQYDEAVEQLLNAVTVQPGYAKALYDLAQYCSCVLAEAECLMALRDAVALESNYWYAARAEPLFDSLRQQVNDTLESLLSAQIVQMEEDCSETHRILGAVQLKMEQCKQLSGALKVSSHATARWSRASKALNAVQESIDRSDYKPVLAAVKRAADARIIASSTLNDVSQELEALLATQRQRQEEREASWRAFYRFLLGVAAYFLVAGSVGFYFDHSVEGFVSGMGSGICIAIVIVIVINIMDS